MTAPGSSPSGDSPRPASRSGLPALGPRGEGWVLLQAVLFLAAAVASLAPPAWSGPMRLLSTIAGFTLIAVGALLAFRGAVDLREQLTPFPRPTVGAQLRDRGAYSIVRHPIYSGIICAAFGWGLVTASLAVLGVAVLTLAFFDLKSRREEAWLMEAIDGYAAYRRRTRKLIPWLY